MRAAEKLTYPVVVKPVMRNSAAVMTVNISGPEGMTAAVRGAQHTDRRVIVEKHISGDRFTLIIAGHRLIGALAANGEQVTSSVHPSLVELSTTLSGAIGFGLLVLTVVSTDITVPLRPKPSNARLTTMYTNTGLIEYEKTRVCTTCSISVTMDSRKSRAATRRRSPCAGE